MSLEYAQHQEKISKIFEGAFFLPPTRRQAKLMELGCGVGALTRLVAAHFPEGKIIAIDSNQALIELGKNKAIEQKLKNISFVKDDIALLKPLPGEYDGAYCRFLLEDLQDPLRALQTMKSSVKEGGWVCAQERLNSYCKVYPHSESIEQMWAAIFEHQQAHHNTHPKIAEQLQGYFNELGLKNVSTQAFSKTLSLQNSAELFTWYIESTVKVFEHFREVLTKKNLRSEQVLNNAIKDYKAILKSPEAFLLEVAITTTGKV